MKKNTNIKNTLTTQPTKIVVRSIRRGELK